LRKPGITFCKKESLHAHRKTAAPIITHTELSSFGRQQAEYLIERGVDPVRIIISHMDRRIDIEKNRGCADDGEKSCKSALFHKALRKKNNE